MLDLLHHFFDKGYLKKTIDRLTMFKMDIIYTHFIDDQGCQKRIKTECLKNVEELQS